MKRSISLPSLFVLNTFLVGVMPKAGKAGAVPHFSEINADSVSTSFVVDSNFLKLSFKQQMFGPEHANNLIEFSKARESMFNEQYGSKYNIIDYGRSVKYTLPDGSGFTRMQGSRTWRNMNPGALRPGKITRQMGACGAAGGFAVFPSEEQGMKALKALLRTDSYARLTIGAAIYKYAPPSDHNNTVSYQRKLSRMTGLSLSRKVGQLSDSELDKVANAIKIIEGWKTGKEVFFESSKETSFIAPNIKQYLNDSGVYQRTYNA